jgi:hypothetical protein
MVSGVVVDFGNDDVGEGIVETSVQSLVLFFRLFYLFTV